MFCPLFNITEWIISRGIHTLTDHMKGPLNCSFSNCSEISSKICMKLSGLLVIFQEILVSIEFQNLTTKPFFQVGTDKTLTK